MYCEKCGKPLKNDDRFCSGCGKANPDAALPYADPVQNAHTDQNIHNFQTAPESQAELGFAAENKLSQGTDTTKQQNKKNTGIVTGIIAAAVLIPVITKAAVLISMNHVEYKRTDNNDIITYNEEDIPDKEYVYNDDSTGHYFSPDNQIESQVIWENHGVTVTARKIEYNGMGSFAELCLQTENNSANDVCLSSDYITVNGYMIGGTTFAEIPAGQKSNSSLYIDIDDLNSAGIVYINELSVCFRLLDSETFDIIEASDSDVITTTNPNHDQKTTFKGTNLYNQNGVNIDFLSVSKYDDYTSVDLLIENNSSTAYNFSIRKTSADNCVLNECYSYSCPPYVNPGTTRIEHIIIDPSELSEYDIDEKYDFSFSYEITEGYEYSNPINTEIMKIKIY